MWSASTDNCVAGIIGFMHITIVTSYAEVKEQITLRLRPHTTPPTGLGRGWPAWDVRLASATGTARRVLRAENNFSR